MIVMSCSVAAGIAQFMNNHFYPSMKASYFMLDLYAMSLII